MIKTPDVYELLEWHRRLQREGHVWWTSQEFLDYAQAAGSFFSHDIQVEGSEAQRVWQQSLVMARGAGHIRW